MQDDRQDRPWLSRLALPASLGLHLIAVALLIFGLPHILPKPQEEQAVSVDLVPPPPKPKAAPKPEKPPEKAPASPEATRQAPPQPPVSRLNPVFRFGDRDAGPRKAPDGNGAEDGAKPSPQEAPDDKASVEQKTPPEPDKEAVLSLPDATARTSAPAPAEAPAARKAPQLDEAKTLFSRSATGDALATTAMGDLPRDVRGGTLCVTELRAQLLNASPPYFADLLPSYRLKQGTVIEAPSAPFRAGGQWRDLSFRCQVDDDATKVVSFALRIGGPIPRGEWRQRGLPTR